ncbi:hypothetical protein MU582_11980 [Nocardioidaceae bacterium SCSIO 66511]|nr:hypothetical protein MU582_11980 [Nocardioidaceae bacterium SCSIO 66511]
MSTDEFVDYADDDSWPLTPRTRFVMWVALGHVAMAIDSDLADVRGGREQVETVAGDPQSMILNDFPLVTRGQSLAWWTETMKAADRMEEAMRTGDDLAPRTPAEEAVVHMAEGRGWKDAALDAISDDATLSARLESLPNRSDDYEWGEILADITGDGDIEQLWMHRLDGAENPADPVNQMLGVGDYRPEAWHRVFERRAVELEGPFEDEGQ